MRFRLINQRRLAAVLGLCFIASIAQSQDPPNAPLPNPAARPLNMLVLGDWIMWGQGLRSENKAWYQVKIWLAQHTGRATIEKIEAHSGAVIEAERLEPGRVPIDGEVNVAVPTLIDQLERALRYYANGPEVDLVLVSGCANDVDWRRVLNAGNTT